MRELAETPGRSLVNVNLSLSQRLLELTARQRALRVSVLLDEIAKEHEGDVLLLDNTEVLFSPELQQDPLRLLQGLARNQTVVAVWAGESENDNLTYADPVHPEFRRCPKPDAVIVPASVVESTTTLADQENVS